MMDVIKKWHNKDWLYDQYWNKYKSLNDIVNDCKCAKGTILYWFNKFKIPTRNKSESIKNAHKQEKIMGFSILTEEEKNHPKGKEHPNWNNIKDDAHFTVIHRYIKRRKNKPKICSKCNHDIYKIELSFDHSLGKHTRNVEDYKWLCQSCHKKRDWALGIMNNQYTKKRNIK